jgi:Na+-transporting NADH:ubiquinone oxidoreductase subunit C
MNRSKLYSVVFVLIITVFWGFALSFAATSLRAPQQANETLNMRTNILQAVGLMERDEALEPEERNKLYEESVESFLVDHEGKVIPGSSAEGVDLEEELENPDPAAWRLPVFVVTEGGRASVYAIPVFGKGLWSTLYGYLALSNDLDTVAGITFYKHGETAGLGAEIEQAWFQDNFVGKKIFDGNELRSIRVVKGKVEDVLSRAADHTYAVDGISGASMTGRGVTNLLDEKLTIYEPYIRRVRAETQAEVR